MMMRSRGMRPMVAAAFCAAAMVSGTAFARQISGTATTELIRECPSSLTEVVPIRGKLVQVLQDWTSASDERVKTFQRECGISGPTFSVGPKTKDCADRLAQQIVNERASGGGGGGAGAIRLPSATIVGDLAQEYCEGTSGTVVFRDSAFFLDCSNFNTFELRPDVTTCNPASADANAPLVCTEWDVVQVSGASSSFCDSGFGTFVCYVFPAVVGAVAVTAGTIWVGTETGAIHGTIKDGGTP